MTIEASASSASPAAAVPDKPHREPAGPLALSLTVLAVVTVLALSWYYATSLLLLFAGILFAVLLDACTRGLARVVPLTRPWPVEPPTVPVPIIPIDTSSTWVCPWCFVGVVPTGVAFRQSHVRHRAGPS